MAACQMADVRFAPQERTFYIHSLRKQGIDQPGSLAFVHPLLWNIRPGLSGIRRLQSDPSWHVKLDIFRDEG
jgi:hypothetical protein